MDNSKNQLILLGSVLVIVLGLSFYTSLKLTSIQGGVTGRATGVANVNIPASTAISLVVSTVDFGDLVLGSSEDTSDGIPAPLVLRNDGSVKVNITIEATDIFTGTSAANPSSYYQFKSAENEAGSVVSYSDLVFSWTDMAAAGAAVKFVTNLKFATAFDEVKGHIKLTVPADESAGSKSSTITFTASQA